MVRFIYIVWLLGSSADLLNNLNVRKKILLKVAQRGKINQTAAIYRLLVLMLMNMITQV